MSSLDNMFEEKNTPQKYSAEFGIGNITQSTAFSKTIDDAKVNVVAQASVEDKQFVDDFKKELKLATLKSAELEKEKQELEKKNIELQQQFLQTKTELEKQIQKTNKWDNKEKSRNYHYNGLKDIMQFVHINNPMCIWLMYAIAIIVSPIYLVWTLLLCPMGTLIAGTKENERPKLVKGAIYTILVITLAIAVVFGVYAIIHFCFGWI